MSEDIKQDASAITWNKKYSFLLLLLIPIILSMYLRVMPAYLPFIDEKAEDDVLLGLKNQISKAVDKQYSSLPQENKDVLIKKQYDEYLKQHQSEIDQVIYQQSKKYKDNFQDDTGHTYLLEVDPWHWYRLARNYIDHGYDRNVAYEGKYYDTYISAGLPLVLLFGITVSTIYKLFVPGLISFSKEKFFLSEIVTKVLVVIIFLVLLLILLIHPFKQTSVTIHSETKAILVNDQWYNILVNIKDKSAPDAIITSWWDFGHFFKAIGDRATTLDGGNQNSPQAHWIGKLLLTDNEKESVGILRMLACGATVAFDELEQLFNHDQVKTKKVVDHIILLSKNEAKKYLLQQDLSEQQAEHILQYTHCQPPENYLIVSSDMIPKSSSWAHFGSWNFSRAQVIYLTNKNMKEEAVTFMREDMALTKEQAEETYTQIKSYSSGDKATAWIAPWYSYRPLLNLCKKIDNNFVCLDALMVNLTEHQVYKPKINGDKVYSIISSFIDEDGNYTVENLEYSNKTFFTTKEDEMLGVSIYLDRNRNYYNFYMDPILVNSMFNKMMLFSDHIHFKCFDLFDNTGSISEQNKIQVWKVDWNCTS
ncbi:hypothetical protein HYY69_05145 [Candidatus Woesearchaeota archaeon]|nr:hypothetical protein [Candidatus Woesearchaeota archaeon]